YGLDRLTRMAPSAQFERGELSHATAKGSPLRLARTVGLLEREVGAQLGRRQGPEEWVSAGFARRQEHDAGNPQRRFGQPIPSATQINLEFLDAASALDDRGLGDGRGFARAPQPTQRVGANVQEIGDPRGKHRVRFYKYAVLRKKIEAIQQPMQCHSRFSRAAWTHQQNSTTVKTYASGVQWHQTLGTGGEGEDRELDQLIASVVRKSQHL